ncbi:MAG: DNA polymerase III subunit gamma/tau, partial [SAR324 cluster bacterium]|nr:DNA polymerase III subunit gamma/tau [SAR324 cluster bacterium]
NACGNCEEITRDASPDVHEIYAASNRAIDNIRELRDNTKYTPAKCTYKTYIIDEVHMLTMESFNALLKTLEEPPPHIRFILATTAPHRIPETVLSRCQRFDFPRIGTQLIVDYLGGVTAAEGIKLSPASLETIARNALGGMRDALTAVDQVVAFAGASPSEEQVLSVLGVMDSREVLTLLGALLDKSLPDALATFAMIVERGHDLSTLLEALLREVKDLSLFKTLGGKALYFQDHAPETLEFFSSRKDGASLDELQQLFYLLLELESQLRQSEYSWACFEMALVKACRVAPLVGVPELLAQVRGLLDQHPATTAQPPQTEHRPPAGARPRERQSAGGGQSAGGSQNADVPPDQDGEAEGAAPPRQSTPPAPEASGAGEQQPLRSQSPPNTAPTELLADAPSELTESMENDPRAESAPASDAPSELTESIEKDPPVESSPATHPPLDEPLPCEDARWVAFVEAVNRTRRKLAADLRRAEVMSIGAGEVELRPPDAAGEISREELDLLQQSLTEAFGDPFHLRLNRDSNREFQHVRSMVGREEQKQAAALATRREAAAADEGVQRILKFFPNGKIERIQSGEEQSDRGKDV